MESNKIADEVRLKLTNKEKCPACENEVTLVADKVGNKEGYSMRCPLCSYRLRLATPEDRVGL